MFIVSSLIIGQWIKILVSGVGLEIETYITSKEKNVYKWYGYGRKCSL